MYEPMCSVFHLFNKCFVRLLLTPALSRNVSRSQLSRQWGQCVCILHRACVVLEGQTYMRDGRNAVPCPQSGLKEVVHAPRWPAGAD